MAAVPFDFTKGSAGIPVTLTIVSSDPAYLFPDVTGARVSIRKGSVGGGSTVVRVADSFAVIAGDLVVIVTLLAEDLNEKGTIYLIPIAERPSGDLPGEERSRQIGV